MLRYQQADSSLTLAEGLDEYFDAHAVQFRDRNYTAAAREFFRCHDALHVVLGCDITLADEMTVKITSMFGTTAGFSVLRGYALPESKEIYEDLGVGLIVATTLKAFGIVPRTLWRCFRMTRRWPWEAFDAYLDVPLKQIRQEFGLPLRAAVQP